MYACNLDLFLVKWMFLVMKWPFEMRWILTCVSRKWFPSKTWIWMNIWMLPLTMNLDESWNEPSCFKSNRIKAHDICQESMIFSNFNAMKQSIVTKDHSRIIMVSWRYNSRTKMNIQFVVPTIHKVKMKHNDHKLANHNLMPCILNNKKP